MSFGDDTLDPANARPREPEAVRDLRVSTEIFSSWVMTKAQGLELLAHIAALEARR